METDSVTVELFSGLIGLVIVLIPFWVIFSKTGNSKLWLAVLIVPFFGIFFVWLTLALSDWPNKPRRA